jgi:hypothetical protein
MSKHLPTILAFALALVASAPALVCARLVGNHNQTLLRE